MKQKSFSSSFGLPTGEDFWILIRVLNIGARGGVGVLQSHFLVISSIKIAFVELVN